VGGGGGLPSEGVAAGIGERAFFRHLQGEKLLRPSENWSKSGGGKTKLGQVSKTEKTSTRVRRRCLRGRRGTGPLREEGKKSVEGTVLRKRDQHRKKARSALFCKYHPGRGKKKRHMLPIDWHTRMGKKKIIRGSMPVQGQVSCRQKIKSYYKKNGWQERDNLCLWKQKAAGDVGSKGEEMAINRRMNIQIYTWGGGPQEKGFHAMQRTEKRKKRVRGKPSGKSEGKKKRPNTGRCERKEGCLFCEQEKTQALAQKSL